MCMSNIPDSEATADQSMHAIKVQLAEAVIGVIYWTMVCSYRSRNDSKSAAHPSMGDSSQARNVELTAQPVNSWRDWRASIPGTSIDISLFRKVGLFLLLQAAGLISEPSLHLFVVA